MSEEIEIKDEVLDLKVTDKYDENQIQVLEGLRGRPQAPGYVHRLYLGHAACTIWCMRSSITRSTRRWQATARDIDVTIEQGRYHPRCRTTAAAFPVGIHPQMGIPTLEVCTHRPARRRQVRRRRLQGIRRSARRWFIGRKRAVQHWLEADVYQRRQDLPSSYMRCEQGAIRPSRCAIRRARAKPARPFVSMPRPGDL